MSLIRGPRRALLYKAVFVPVSLLFLQVSTKKPSQEDSTLFRQMWFNPTEFSCQMDVKTQKWDQHTFDAQQSSGSRHHAQSLSSPYRAFQTALSPSSLFMIALCLMVGETRDGKSTKPTSLIPPICTRAVPGLQGPVSTSKGPRSGRPPALGASLQGCSALFSAPGQNQPLHLSPSGRQTPSSPRGRRPVSYHHYLPAEGTLWRKEPPSPRALIPKSQPPFQPPSETAVSSGVCSYGL